MITQELLEDVSDFKTEFNRLFAPVRFSDLEEQTDNVLTNDSCTHYRDPKTKQVYSCNYRNHKSSIPANDSTVRSLHELFVATAESQLKFRPYLIST
jgi:hypothetical protein